MRPVFQRFCFQRIIMSEFLEGNWQNLPWCKSELACSSDFCPNGLKKELGRRLTENERKKFWTQTVTRRNVLLLVCHGWHPTNVILKCQLGKLSVDFFLSLAVALYWVKRVHIARNLDQKTFLTFPACF